MRTNILNVFLHFALTVSTCLAVAGCGGPSGPTTEAGLRDENQVLKEQVADLRSQNESLRVEIKAVKESLEHDSKTRFDNWKTAHAEELAAKSRAAEQREAALKQEIVQLKEENASLTLDNGARRREILALNEIVDSQPRTAAAFDSRWRAEQVVVYLFLGISLLLLGFVTLRYRDARTRMNFLSMQQVSQLRHVGGEKR